MATSSKHSIVYKVLNGLDIRLDIHIPPDAHAVPVLLWFHGGGLLQGHRDSIAPHMLESISKYKHALITADYRLAPQVGIQDIFADVQDCIAFIRQPEGLAKHLNGIVGADSVDYSRLAVSGSSAGGYLALLAGLYAQPKPKVILPIYPITDPLGTFFTTSQPWPLERNGLVDPHKRVEDATVQPHLDRNPATALSNNASDSSRAMMSNHMLDRANLADLLHFDLKSDPQHDLSNNKWRVAKQIAEHRLPPTYVVHGTVDRDVGVEQADEAVGVMVGEGLEVMYERLKGKDHVFDVVDSSEKLESMYAFMHKHV